MGNVAKNLFGLWVFLLLFVRCVAAVVSGDAAALLTFKAFADPGHRLNLMWRSRDYCKWKGVEECSNGRVTKLVLEYLHLNGSFAEKTLSRLDQLRVLSLKGNSLSGPIPDLSGLNNLKSLFLDHNNFTGSIPESIHTLHRLKVIVLSDNSLSGEIPESLLSLQRLYVLLLENNHLNGSIPPFNQSAMKMFNVSNNKLSGAIPNTVALSGFNSSSFLGNHGLCGRLLHQSCSAMSPAPSPLIFANSPEQQTFPVQIKKQRKLSRGKIAGIAVGATVGLLAALFIVCFCCRRDNREQHSVREEEKTAGEKLSAADQENVSDQYYAASVRTEQRQQQRSGTLMFCGGEPQLYTLEDLLRASAEIMGRGTLGTTYKAVIENRLIVTVKRLKNSNKMSREEFERHMEMVGRLRHQNIVPLRAYFQAREERLLVYDYHPNGSLFALIHGVRSSRGKPLHWTSCLKIAEDVANGLAYLHQASRLIHGNLKSSNVLVGGDFEACITDFGLTVFDSEEPEETSVLSYKAPECIRSNTKKIGPKSDVYSFGVLLLELLTGKTPLKSFLNGHDMDLYKWVRSVREEEHQMEGAGLDGSVSAVSESSEDKLVMLLNIAMACVSSSPEQRPTMRQVLRMIEEVKEIHFAANSSQTSGESPKWSDAVNTAMPLDTKRTADDHSFTEGD